MANTIMELQEEVPRLKANEEAVKKLEEAKEQIEILSKEKVEWKNKFDDQAMIL